VHNIYGNESCFYIFHCKVEAASPTETTLSEQTLASEFWFCQAEESCPGRVNLCHEDETRKAGGLIPD
jgi:hypothetical protein